MVYILSLHREKQGSINVHSGKFIIRKVLALILKRSSMSLKAKSGQKGCLHTVTAWNRTLSIQLSPRVIWLLYRL